MRNYFVTGMKLINICFLIYLIPKSVKAQTEPLQSFLKIEYNIFSLGPGYELRLSNGIIIDASIGIGRSFVLRDPDRRIAPDLYPHLVDFVPYASISPKFYIKRTGIKKLLNSRLNGGTYIGGKAIYIKESKRYDNTDPIFKGSVNFGSQAALSNRIFLNYYVGGGGAVNLNTNYRAAFLTLGIELSYAFKKQNQ